MTTITLELPDDLAARLAPIRQDLPSLLSRALELRAAESFASAASPAPNQPVYQEVLHFLTSRPTTEQILSFKASLPVQSRLEELLDRNREERLREEEEVELDAYEQINDFMILLKAQARTAQPRIH